MPIRMDKSLIFIFCMQQLDVSKMYFKKKKKKKLIALSTTLSFPLESFLFLLYIARQPVYFSAKQHFLTLCFMFQYFLLYLHKMYRPIKKYFFDNHLQQYFPGLCIPFQPINVASAMAVFSVCQVILKTCSVKLIFTRKLS